MEYTIKTYRTSTGEKPFSNWMNELSDRIAKAAIYIRIERLKKGNFGIAEPVGNGVYELKFDIGPGYRVYFAKIGLEIVLILCAGSKRKQSQDITKAKNYYVDYQKRSKERGYDE